MRFDLLNLNSKNAKIFVCLHLKISDRKINEAISGKKINKHESRNTHLRKRNNLGKLKTRIIRD